MAPLKRKKRYGYPLSALFVLTTACGVVCALITPVVRAAISGNVGMVELLETSLGGSIAVMLTSGIVGLNHHRPGRGFLWGIITGGIVGLVATPLAVAPRSAFPSLLVTSLVGSVVLIALAILLDWSRPQRRSDARTELDRVAD